MLSVEAIIHLAAAPEKKKVSQSRIRRALENRTYSRFDFRRRPFSTFIVYTQAIVVVVALALVLVRRRRRRRRQQSNGRRNNKKLLKAGRPEIGNLMPTASNSRQATFSLKLSFTRRRRGHHRHRLICMNAHCVISRTRDSNSQAETHR